MFSSTFGSGQLQCMCVTSFEHLITCTDRSVMDFGARLPPSSLQLTPWWEMNKKLFSWFTFVLKHVCLFVISLN